MTMTNRQNLDYVERVADNLLAATRARHVVDRARERRIAAIVAYAHKRAGGAGARAGDARPTTIR